MLKNKKAIYILIPLNVFIWGFFIYRFYTAYAGDAMPELPASARPLPLAKLEDSVIYRLALNYKDPFLKDARIESVHYEIHEQPQAAVKRETVPPKPATPIIKPVLPEIKYLGLIKNTSSGLSTALITLNGRSLLIKQNETADGVVFKSFNRDSLVARWGKERIVARK